MISKDFFQALEDLESLRKVKKEVFIEALETALTSAYKKNYGEAKSAVVKLNSEKCKIEVYSYKTIVETPEEIEDPDKQMLLEEARKIKKSYKVGDTVQQEENPKDFGRIAVQTAKQVVMQKLREVERENIIGEISQKEDELVTTIVSRIDGNNVFVELGANQIEAVMGLQDQIPGERYYVNQRLKVYVKKIKEGIKGPMLQVSRANTGFVKKLFELEIPEIANGEVVVNSVSREAGYRTKIAVSTSNANIDPIGACVGDRGIRINTIISELNGEKIDIIEYSDDMATYVARALSPAEVENVQMIADGQALAVVPDDKLSLAIGKSGQNVRLAARLTHCKIDVKSHTVFENDSAHETYEKP
ncbi:MAG: transcription termination/antitermination protein NusA, partial [Clostridia bacterium]|nr:transcription termination/antitermination protein NusA [Clostridia bacterium]